MMNWEIFCPILTSLDKKKPDVQSRRRKPIDPILMFKVLILQRLYAFSDEQAEFQIRDRASFQRFLGFFSSNGSPDYRTIWYFRERLHEEDIAPELVARLDEVLLEQGFRAQGGQIVDASFVEVPRQRNTREENAQIKSGTTPPQWEEKTASVIAQKDVDARWAKKNQETHYSRDDNQLGCINQTD